MKCEHIDTGGGYYQQPCDRDATHQITYTRHCLPVGTSPNVTTVFSCRHHAPWKLAKRQPEYCKIDKVRNSNG